MIIINDSQSDVICFLSRKSFEKSGFSDLHSTTEIIKNGFGSLIPRNFGGWEEYIEECDMKKARIYVIATDSVDKYGWDKIYEKGIYKKKYLLTIEDLDKINWEITYDGK